MEKEVFVVAFVVVVHCWWSKMHSVKLYTCILLKESNEVECLIYKKGLVNQGVCICKCGSWYVYQQYESTKIIHSKN